MMPSRRRKRSTVAGFTLIEALAATVLMGMILTALASVTSRWLASWDRGFVRAQRGELVSIALDRLVADLGAAEFVTASRSAKVPMFDGTPLTVTLVRTAYGPNARPGLEMVRIAETSDRSGTVLVRSKAPFVPLTAGQTAPNPLSFTDPVALLRAPLRVTFAYAGRDSVFRDTWQGAPLLPTTVRVTVRDAASDRTLSISTAALVHVELPAACARAKDKGDCAGKSDEDTPGNDPAQQPQAAPASTNSQRNAVGTL
jgi:general secretion pathway protein J